MDFGEVWVVLNGVKTKCHMFVFRLSNSGRAIHRIYPTQAQEAFRREARGLVPESSGSTTGGRVSGMPPQLTAPASALIGPVWLRMLKARSQLAEA